MLLVTPCRYLHYYARQIVLLHPSAAERAEAKMMEEGAHALPSRRLGLSLLQRFESSLLFGV